jgi:hypothetical protein
MTADRRFDIVNATLHEIGPDTRNDTTEMHMVDNV